jgi:hypothetical protein
VHAGRGCSSFARRSGVAAAGVVAADIDEHGCGGQEQQAGEQKNRSGKIAVRVAGVSAVHGDACEGERRTAGRGR